jgi:hypothetical protein
MIFKIFLQSIKTSWNEKKTAVLLWAVSLLVALPSFWTVQRSVNSYFGGRSVASEWLHEFKLGYFLEMINDFPAITATFNATAGASVIVFLIATLFLTGGVIGRLYANAGQLFYGNFFIHCGTFFFRFFRVFLWTMLLSFFSLVFMMIGGYAGLITAALIALWIMTSDVTKIRLFADDSSTVTRTYFSSMVWVFKNFPAVFSVYLLNFSLLALGFMVYKLMDDAITPDSGFMILIMFVWQQAYVFFRSIMRIQFFTGAILLWKERPIKVEITQETEAVSDQTDQSEQIQSA